MCLWLPCECQDFNFFLDFTFSAIIVKLAQSNFLTSEVLCLGNCCSFIRNPSSVTCGGSLQLQRRQSGVWSFGGAGWVCGGSRRGRGAAGAPWRCSGARRGPHEGACGPVLSAGAWAARLCSALAREARGVLRRAVLRLVVFIQSPEAQIPWN